jgi:hypothetical protein
MTNRKNPFDAMTQEQFDDILGQVVSENCGALLGVPGAYEVFAEHYHNEVLDRWAEKNGLELPEDE